MNRVDYGDRKSRALSQPIYFLNHAAEGENDLFKIHFGVQGTTKNNYTVTLSPREKTCTCPDFYKRSMHCKHIYFVLWRVLKLKHTEHVRLDDLVQFNKTHTSEEKEKEPTTQTQNELQVKFKTKQREYIGCECCICTDEFNASSRVVYCGEVCGQSLHQECWSRYSAFQKFQELQIAPICPYCHHTTAFIS